MEGDGKVGEGNDRSCGGGGDGGAKDRKIR